MALACVLIAAAGGKVAAFEVFTGSVFRTVTELGLEYNEARRLGQVVILAEAVAGLAVFLPRLVGRARVCIGALLGGFAAWDLLRFLLNEGPDCGCFGSVVQFSAWWQVVLKHGVLAALFAAYCVERSPGERGAATASERP